MLEALLSGWDTSNGRDTAGPRDFVFRSLEALFRDSVEAIFQRSRDKAANTPPHPPSGETPVSG